MVAHGRRRRARAVAGPQRRAKIAADKLLRARGQGQSTAAGFGPRLWEGTPQRPRGSDRGTVDRARGLLQSSLARGGARKRKNPESA